MYLLQREQLNDHENRIYRLENELEDHLSKAPEKGAPKRLIHEFVEKENFLQFEVEFKIGSQNAFYLHKFFIFSSNDIVHTLFSCDPN